MLSLDELMDFMNKNDHFISHNHIRLTKLEQGYAEAEMAVTNDAINGRNYVQGGAIYTLADFTFAGASNSFGCQAVTMNSSISYIRPGTGKKLYAVAKAINKGHKTGVFEIRVTDSRKRLIAVVTSTAFFTDQPCEEMLKNTDGQSSAEESK